MATTELKYVFQCTADVVWETVGSFERYEWGAGVEPGTLEDSRQDNEIGVVRAFRYYDAPARQRLSAYSAFERTYSWESLEPYEDISHYVQTIDVQPLADDRSVMTWHVNFDAPPSSIDTWSPFFRQEFAKSFEKLAGILATGHP